MSMFDLVVCVFRLILKTARTPSTVFSLAMLPNSHLFDYESACLFCKISLEEVYMLEVVTTFEETTYLACSVWMVRVTLT